MPDTDALAPLSAAGRHDTTHGEDRAMQGLAAMRRRITLGAWEGHYPSQNAESAEDGATADIALDGKQIGSAARRPWSTPYHFLLGKYPREKYHGDYRTENAMLDALARVLIEKGQ